MLVKAFTKHNKISSKKNMLPLLLKSSKQLLLVPVILYKFRQQLFLRKFYSACYFICWIQRVGNSPAASVVNILLKYIATYLFKYIRTSSHIHCSEFDKSLGTTMSSETSRLGVECLRRCSAVLTTAANIHTANCQYQFWATLNHPHSVLETCAGKNF